MSRNQILLGSDNQRFSSMSYNPRPNTGPNSQPEQQDGKLKTGDLQQKVQAHFNSGINDIQLDGQLIDEFQFYRKYNEKFNQQFNEMFQNQNFSVYQKDLLEPSKEKDDVYEFLVPTDTLNPLLHKLDSENKILKTELNYIGCDLKKFIVMVEILLDENKFIREHINQKNRDIQKLIESIAVNESEDVHDLKHKIHIINEENNILFRHLQEMKKYKDSYDSLAQNSDNEIQSFKNDFSNLRDDLDNALRREENLTKQLAILEPKYSKETDKSIQLEANLEECSLRLNNYQNEILTLKNENTLYKRTYEEQNKKLKQEVETLNNQISKFQQQYNNYVEGQMELKKQNDFLRSENQNLFKELEESRNDQVPIQQYLEEFKNQLQIERQKVDQSASLAKGLKEKLDTSTSQNDKLNLKLQQLDHQYNNLLNQSKFDLQEKHNKYEEILKNLQFSYKNQLEEKEDEIITISQQLSQQKTQIDKLTQELDIKSRSLSDLKLQLVDNQDNKRKNESLELHNKLQTTEIVELNSKITNFKLSADKLANVQRENEELLKQTKKQENQIQQLQSQNYQDTQLNQDIVILQQSNDTLRMQKENLEVRNENLKKEVTGLRQELQGIVNTNIDLRVNQQKKIQIDNEQLQYSNKFMQQQINSMTFQNLPNVSQNIRDDTQDEQMYSEQKLANQQNQQRWMNYQQK